MRVRTEAVRRRQIPPPKAAAPMTTRTTATTLMLDPSAPPPPHPTSRIHGVDGGDPVRLTDCEPVVQGWVQSEVATAAPPEPVTKTNASRITHSAANGRPITTTA